MHRVGAPVQWGQPGRGGPLGAALRGIVQRARAAIGQRSVARPPSLGPLPVILRRGDLAATYLAAERSSDHPAAADAATSARQRAVTEQAWWPADIWGHRALWHYERAGMELEAVRGARLIGDVRVAGGDPASARRYYAEAISEARDIGAEREEGLAALGMGRAEMQLRNVTTARRLGQIAVELLERSEAPEAEVEAARELHGEEKEV